MSRRRRAPFPRQRARIIDTLASSSCSGSLLKLDAYEDLYCTPSIGATRRCSRV
jgi:hypothetical protein